MCNGVKGHIQNLLDAKWYKNETGVSQYGEQIHTFRRTTQNPNNMSKYDCQKREPRHREIIKFRRRFH
jgi:hypothetical protein